MTFFFLESGNILHGHASSSSSSSSRPAHVRPRLQRVRDIPPRGSQGVAVAFRRRRGRVSGCLRRCRRRRRSSSSSCCRARSSRSSSAQRRPHAGTQQGRQSLRRHHQQRSCRVQSRQSSFRELRRRRRRGGSRRRRRRRRECGCDAGEVGLPRHRSPRRGEGVPLQNTAPQQLCSPPRDV